MAILKEDVAIWMDLEKHGLALRSARSLLYKIDGGNRTEFGLNCSSSQCPRRLAKWQNNAVKWRLIRLGYVGSVVRLSLTSEEREWLRLVEEISVLSLVANKLVSEILERIKKRQSVGNYYRQVLAALGERLDCRLLRLGTCCPANSLLKKLPWLTQQLVAS